MTSQLHRRLFDYYKICRQMQNDMPVSTHGQYGNIETGSRIPELYIFAVN